MPILTKALPKYSKHRASGQAVVTLCGKDFYLGPYGTKVSRLEYDRLVAQWLANGRTLPGGGKDQAAITVIEVLTAYKKHAAGYYVKNGKITNEFAQIMSALKVVKQLYGREPAAEFGPLKLRAVQQAMMDLDWSRKHINKQIGRVIRTFAWAVSKELVAPSIPQALREVPGLLKGRSGARESEPVLPVTEEAVNKTLPHLPKVVADMVRLQRLSGGRPEEICMLRPCDVDVSGDVWAYTPESHKTEHHEKRRVLFIGPRAQEVLRPYLSRGNKEYCFSPALSEGSRRAENHSRRTTKLQYGNRPGTNRRPSPARKPGERYTTASYRRAIHRACEKAFAMPVELQKLPKGLSDDQKKARKLEAAVWRAKHCWSPNQLRHSAATEIRQRFGLEAAQVTLGHAIADVTQIYAERDLAKAAEVMRIIG